MKLKTLLAVSALLLPALALAAPNGRANRRPRQSQKALCLEIAVARAHMVTYNVTCRSYSKEEAVRTLQVENAGAVYRNQGCQNILSEADVRNATMAEINRLGGRNLNNEQYCSAIKPAVDKAEEWFDNADADGVH
ncbi:hypothetical protein [Eikenella sp. NML120348]|uniref:hypothetical protein n=1 Tax=Eikenella sp. NML120348 TaxID=1795831 RepID=UPI00082B57AF|nr:hypothetical protein [Eikenella sp. NML120348]